MPGSAASPTTTPLSAEMPAAVMIGKHVGSYRIVRQLGQGGMGAVFEAIHEQIGQSAAIKILNAEIASDKKQVERFFDEARAISKVEHPGLVKIFDFQRTENGTVYIIMEMLRGEPLWGRYLRLKDSGTWLSLGDALRLTRQLASTLSAVHSKGIIHRDLKPENVIVVADPEAVGGERAKIVDFGIAKFESTEGGARRTTVGTVLGTPIYMSPEQCRGGQAVDAKSDVYSLGVMLYEMLTGHPPFQAKEGGLLMASHIFREPPALAERPDPPPQPVCALVHDMLAKEPASRPDMAQVLSRLAEMAQTMPHLSGLEPSGVMHGQALRERALSNPGRRSLGMLQVQTKLAGGLRLWPVAAGLVLGVLVIGVIGLRTRSGRPAQQVQPMQQVPPPPAIQQVPPQVPPTLPLAASRTEEPARDVVRTKADKKKKHGRSHASGKKHKGKMNVPMVD